MPFGWFLCSDSAGRGTDEYLKLYFAEQNGTGKGLPDVASGGYDGKAVKENAASGICTASYSRHFAGCGSGSRNIPSGQQVD